MSRKGEEKQIFLTQEGYNTLREELKYLETEKRQEIMNSLKEARSFGDLSENAEYDAARDAQGKLEQRIREIERILEGAIVVEDNANTDVVSVGSLVEIEYEDKEVERYKIVGSAEADPFQNKISYESPIASAIMNQKEGSIVDVNSPNGIFKVKVVRIGSKES